MGRIGDDCPGCGHIIEHSGRIDNGPIGAETTGRSKLETFPVYKTAKFSRRQSGHGDPEGHGQVALNEGRGNVQSLFVPPPGGLFLIAQGADVQDLPQEFPRPASRQGFHRHLPVRREGEHGGVKPVAPAGEADVPGGIEHVFFREVPFLHLGGAFARDLPHAGIVNGFLKDLGWIKDPLPFWTDPTWARFTVIIVNIWIGIPYLMLIATGILMNIPADLYESAKIDGASGFQQYAHITLPYMLFVTGPYLLTSFTGNMNNFNVIYLLTGGGPDKAWASAAGGSPGQTDLLITWLFKVTTGAESKYYQASVIGIMVFVVMALITVVVYGLLPSNKNEEDFQ